MAYLSRKSEDLAELLIGLRMTPTASLSDALDRMGKPGFMSHELRPIIPGVKIVGPAVTVKHKKAAKTTSFNLCLELIDKAKPGDVFVVSGDLDLRDVGLLGGLMATAAKARGMAGAILDGGVRDVRELREMGFQVFSRSVIPTTSLGRTDIEAVNVPIVCGGVTVNPGDIIVADDDGVVVLPRASAQEALKRANEYDEVERKEAEDLRRGAPLVETIKKYARV
ncbi:MAG: RraA family protein [Candidatus Bathyarchaeia archaeon]